MPGILELDYVPEDCRHRYKATLTYMNLSDDTLLLHNVVSFGEASDHVYLTGKGDHTLSLSHLFVPGKEPANVILPDKAWELGFSAVDTKNGPGLCALTRRVREPVENGRRQSFETGLYPGGRVSYTFWADYYSGEWQEGLRIMFRERMLYDIEPCTFDNTLFEREYLRRVRHSYVAHLMQAWDNYFYDAAEGKYRLEEFLTRGKKLY